MGNEFNRLISFISSIVSGICVLVGLLKTDSTSLFDKDDVIDVLFCGIDKIGEYKSSVCELIELP